MVTCRLTACTPGSAPGPTLRIEYEKPLPFLSQHYSQSINQVSESELVMLNHCNLLRHVGVNNLPKVVT